MHVFITGIKGFMGTHLANALANEGHLVTGIDNLFHPCKQELNKFVTFYEKDIRDIDWLRKYFQVNQVHPIDVIIHLAAQIHVDYSIKFPQETLDINVKGTANILEMAKKYNIKCIVASTSEIYGSSQTPYMSETHPLDAQSPYGASKVGADRLAKSYVDTYGMDIVTVRNFNAFGPYQNDGSYGSVISRFTKAGLAGEPMYIYGTGNQERDYMYIDDIVQAYKFAIDRLPADVYNFGTGKTEFISDIAFKIRALTGSKSRVVKIKPRAGEVKRLCCDITKVKKFGFRPNTDFNRDLKKYVDWYKTNERT